MVSSFSVVIAGAWVVSVLWVVSSLLVVILGAWVVSVLLWTPWIVAWPYIEGRRTVADIIPVNSPERLATTPCVSSSYSESPLLPSITASLFHFRLETYQFHISFPLHSLSSSLGSKNGPSRRLLHSVLEVQRISDNSDCGGSFLSACSNAIVA